MQLDNQTEIADILFFFNDTATTEIYTLSLHDALPILKIKNIYKTAKMSSTGKDKSEANIPSSDDASIKIDVSADSQIDRKSTRLNSSHLVISYAVFCLKKKTKAPSRHRS